MKITFLGSGDAFSSGGKMHTCILVESATRQFLIDCGASAMIGIKKYRVNPNDVDCIFISHLHGDHFGGIPFFLLDAQLVSKRSRPLTIAGPSGTKTRILEAMEIMFPGSSKTNLKFNLDFVELDAENTASFFDIPVTPYLVNHASGAPSFALRIEHQGKVITYTGDTEWTETLAAASRNADLLIAECYYYDKKIKYHLDYETLTSHLPKMGPKRVILTHMSDDMLAKLTQVEHEYAEDGKVFIL